MTMTCLNWRKIEHKSPPCVEALQFPGRWGEPEREGMWRHAGAAYQRPRGRRRGSDQPARRRGLVRERVCRARGGGRRGGPALSQVGGESGRAFHRHQSRRTHGRLDAGARGARAAPRIADRLLFRALFALRAGTASVALDLREEALWPGRFVPAAGAADLDLALRFANVSASKFIKR